MQLNQMVGKDNATRVKRLVPIIMIVVACLFISASAQAAGKVLFVDSYHQGYAWSDGIEQGIRKVLEGSGTELKVVLMDTKRNTASGSSYSV